ncbi:MAG: lytic transglycosylase domain-containing protein [Bacteroidota bacterium]|nr:lytic transglycosylase domain-containing protein [Bacteroidota bacterium]
MKTIQSKILLTLIIIFFIVGFSVSAKSLIEYPVSFSAESEPVMSVTAATNPLAVVYPSNIQECRLETKDYVKSFIKKKRDYIIYIFQKGEKFFPKAVDILDKHDVPMELQMIPVLESQFNANAVSPAGAVGYWQFMAELAREYGLHTGAKNDERKNFVKSTVAAAKFFRDQLDYFNEDLLLSVAAYNCGPGRVQSSIRKSGKKDANFWDIKKYLPFETRRFVMDFIAFNVIAANYEKFLNKKMDFTEPVLIQIAAKDSSLKDDSLTVKAL